MKYNEALSEGVQRNTNGLDSRLETLFKKAQTVSLSPASKTAGLIWLREEMNDGRVVISAPTQKHSWLLTDRKSMVATLLSGMILLGGVGVVSAAQKALPGDALYPFKTGLYENLKVEGASTPQEQAAIHTSLAEVRLKEAEILATQNRLTPDELTLVQSNFNSHTIAAVAAITSIERSGDAFGAASAGSNLESMLAVHGVLMRRIEKRDSAGTDAVAVMTIDIDKALSLATDARSGAEIVLTVSNNKTVTQKIVEQAASAAHSLLSTAIQTVSQGLSRLDPESEASVSDQLGQAQAAQAQADIYRANGDYGKAVLLYGQAFRGARQASLETQAAQLH